MSKYRKLPVEIEAWKVKKLIEMFKGHWLELPECVAEAYERGIITTITDNDFKVKTLEGIMTATKEDYLIKGVNGEFYPCKSEIFEKTYEKVEE